MCLLYIANLYKESSSFCLYMCQFWQSPFPLILPTAAKHLASFLLFLFMGYNYLKMAPHWPLWLQYDCQSFLLDHLSTTTTTIYKMLIMTQLLGQLEKAMAPHSSTLAWKIPWMEEPGRLQSMGSQRVGDDWVTSLSLFTWMHWRRKWQPTPVFLPGESQGWGSLVGCRLWGRTESDMTEVT